MDDQRKDRRDNWGLACLVCAAVTGLFTTHPAFFEIIRFLLIICCLVAFVIFIALSLPYSPKLPSSKVRLDARSSPSVLAVSKSKPISEPTTTVGNTPVKPLGRETVRSAKPVSTVKSSGFKGRGIPAAPEYRDKPAVREAGILILFIASTIGIWGQVFPSPIDSADYVFLCFFIVAALCALWALGSSKHKEPAIGILQGLWWPSIFWGSGDFVAVVFEHSLGWTGMTLSSYYVTVSSNAVAIVGLAILLKSCALKVDRRSAKGNPARSFRWILTLACLSQIAAFRIHDASRYYYMTGSLWVADIVAIISAMTLVWYSFSLRKRVNGKHVLLGWLTTTAFWLIEELDPWSPQGGASQFAGITEGILLILILILTLGMTSDMRRPKANSKSP